MHVTSSHAYRSFRTFGELFFARPKATQTKQNPPPQGSVLCVFVAWCREVIELHGAARAHSSGPVLQKPSPAATKPICSQRRDDQRGGGQGSCRSAAEVDERAGSNAQDHGVEASGHGPAAADVVKVPGQVLCDGAGGGGHSCISAVRPHPCHCLPMGMAFASVLCTPGLHRPLHLLHKSFSLLVSASGRSCKDGTQKSRRSGRQWTSACSSRQRTSRL